MTPIDLNFEPPAAPQKEHLGVNRFDCPRAYSCSFRTCLLRRPRMRNFEKVDELVAEAKAKKAAPVGRSSAMAPLGTMQGQSAPQCSR